MIQEIFPGQAEGLYHYCLATSVNTPYYFPVAFENWRRSMFFDWDYDGTPLFSQLTTLALLNGGRVEGYIQFGISSFVFDTNGQKDSGAGYGVIRSLHYLPRAEQAGELLDRAMEYFRDHRIKRPHAFFHYLGLSCYARQGKLHCSGFYMEEQLRRYSLETEHENVYFSKCLQEALPAEPQDVAIACKSSQSLDFLRGGEVIGGCELYFVPGSGVCFLKWIYIKENLSHQGLGTKCMYKLFHEMSRKGFVRMDTDTACDNTAARNYYEKTGYANRGIMRSYHTT